MSRRTVYKCAALGAIVSMFVMFDFLVLDRAVSRVIDPVDDRLVFVWPSSVMLMATEGQSGITSAVIVAISIAINAFVYALVGFMLSSAIRVIRRVTGLASDSPTSPLKRPELNVARDETASASVRFPRAAMLREGPPRVAFCFAALGALPGVALVSERLLVRDPSGPHAPVWRVVDYLALLFWPTVTLLFGAGGQRRTALLIWGAFAVVTNMLLYALVGYAAGWTLSNLRPSSPIVSAVGAAALAVLAVLFTFYLGSGLFLIVALGCCVVSVGYAVQSFRAIS